MLVANSITDYKILDLGDGMKLEQWGNIVLSRPDPQVIWPKSNPELWDTAHAVYVRSNKGGGEWRYYKSLPERWTVHYNNLQFYVRPTGFKHTGIFPEQSVNWDFMCNIISSRSNTKVLNLFAYTGGATAACASCGASVTHVDAAKSMVAWAKENAELSGLSDKPIRFIVDDCLKFVLREQRRGNKYDAIIMDPPSYGRANGQVWKVEENLFELVMEASKLLSDNPAFFLINSYTTGLSSVVTKNMLELCVKSRHGGKITADDLVIPVENSKIVLPCGTTSRWIANENFV